MKIHKTDKERIYFIMDSGACGSIKREEVVKLMRCKNYLEQDKIDPRSDKCLSEKADELRLEEMKYYLGGL